MHTVIVGGGFAGVRAALEISKRQLGKVTLISDQPYFLHHATLYSTATGRSVDESVIELEDIFATHNDVNVVIDTMVDIDPKSRVVYGVDGEYVYDNLIIAIGVVTNYFGIDGMKDHSFGIKTLNEVNEFRAHIRNQVLAEKKFDKNYIVIGAGPTGIELAGALQEYLTHLAEEHMVKKPKVNIILCEAMDSVLPRSSETAGKKVKQRLEKMGVKVLLNTKVEALSEDHILMNGREVATNTAIWTSGVANNPFFAERPKIFKILERGPRPVIVNNYLEAHKNIYVLGDNAAIKNGGLASTAIKCAEFIADHLARKITGRKLKKFDCDKAPEAYPIGESWAYFEWRGIYVTGRFASFLRRRELMKNYRKLMPKAQAQAAWNAHDTWDDQL